MKIWKYNRCGSCRNAIKYLNNKNLKYTELEILETPPSIEDLKKMLVYMNGDIKKLFNTSGVKYREGNYKDIIKNISDEEAIEILSKDGALIKRPFLLGNDFGIVGFKEDIWNNLLK